MSFAEVTRGILFTPQTTTGIATLPGEMYFNSSLGIIYYHNGQENIMQGADWPTSFVTDSASLTSALGESSVAGGGIIYVKASFTWSGSDIIMPINTILIGTGRNITITINSNNAIRLNADCQVRHLAIAAGAGKTTGDLVQAEITGSRCTVEQCRFTAPATVISINFSFPAHSCKSYRCMYTGGTLLFANGSNSHTDNFGF